MTPELKAAAERTVYQWDNHDKFRPMDALDRIGEFGEPTDVAIARAYLSLAPRIEEMPAWHDRPTGPGLHLCEDEHGLLYHDNVHNVEVFCQTFTGRRVYGPIPAAPKEAT